jgi:hypothetical protein
MTFIRSTSVVTDTAITVGNLSGGTNGKVVRLSGSNTVSDASNTDSTVQLNAILIKQNNVYYASGVVSGFTSLSAGSPYFLASDGSITSTPPTPTSTTKVVYLGFALNTTDLLFRPGTPIAGV